MYVSSKESLPCASDGRGDRGKPGFPGMDSSLQQIFTVQLYILGYCPLCCLVQFLPITPAKKSY